MAEIISTIGLGKDEKFEMLSKKIKQNKKDHPLKQADPRKTCMTRTIIPNRREVGKEDIEKFVNRVKDNNGSNVTLDKEMVKVTDKKETKNVIKENKTETSNNVEKKKRGRPSAKKAAKQSPIVDSTI